MTGQRSGDDDYLDVNYDHLYVDLEEQWRQRDKRRRAAGVSSPSFAITRDPYRDPLDGPQTDFEAFFAHPSAHLRAMIMRLRIEMLSVAASVRGGLLTEFWKIVDDLVAMRARGEIVIDDAPVAPEGAPEDPLR